jgi:hypothetical protein
MEHFVTIRAKTIDFEGSKKDYLVTTCTLLQCVVSQCYCETIGSKACVLYRYDEAYGPTSLATDPAFSLLIRQ